MSLLFQLCLNLITDISPKSPEVKQFEIEMR